MIYIRLIIGIQIFYFKIDNIDNLDNLKMQTFYFKIENIDKLDNIDNIDIVYKN